MTPEQERALVGLVALVRDVARGCVHELGTNEVARIEREAHRIAAALEAYEEKK